MGRTTDNDGYRRALERIAKAERARATRLDLSRLGLTALPAEIGSLAALETLDLAQNNLTDLPAEIGSFAALETLYLSGNQLTTLPPEIGSLAALKELYLKQNNLTTLPAEIGSLAALETLALHKNKLTTLPPEIGSLAALKYLDLSENQLTALPAEIGSLAALETLALHKNKLTTLPAEIGSLAALRKLYLNQNNLTTLPAEIGSLAALETLDLAQNNLTDLPAEIGSLAALKKLYLDSNQLTTLPAEIGSLGALETLDLSRNQLTTLPAEIGSLGALGRLHLDENQLTALPPELRGCEALRELYLHGNDGLEIMRRVLGPTWRSSGRQRGPARPADILDYYFGRQAAAAAGTLRAVNEVKVMLVGRGGAGKTSLRRFFLGLPHNPDEKETQGIALDDFRLCCDGTEITVHLWDFAGQEITHALHQFFLTEGCIYILVLDPRSNTEMTDAFYWLDQVARYASDSPVIVSLNRQDARQGGYDVDRDRLVERYPQICGFVRTNCQTREGCEDLKQQLVGTIEALDSDEPPRLEVPSNWLDVEDECWRMAAPEPPEAGPDERRHTLTFEQFVEVCKPHGVDELDRQESLARLLHKLGAVLHFVDDPRLRDRSVLNPHWVTDGVYRLMRYKDQPESDGIITIGEAAEALEDGSEDSALYLLGLMERFEMCFQVDEDADPPTRWLIPGALDQYQPLGLGEQWKDLKGAIRLRYDYRSPVAEGILPRFIVLTHPMQGEAVWRNGVVLRDEDHPDTAALVRRGENANHIEVTAIGAGEPRLRLLQLIQGMMARINADLPGAPPTVEQEIQARPGVYREIAELKAAESVKAPIVVASDPPPPVVVDPTPELDRVSERESRDGSRRPLRTFLSYCHADRSAMKIFRLNLTVLQQKGYITPWYDGLIKTGVKWKEEIEARLESMDLFIGLLTTPFVASEFIQTVELEAARERLRQRKERDFLFALILVDDIGLGRLDLAQYQLVKPGYRAVADHRSRRHGFDQAQKDIEKLIEQYWLESGDDERGRPGLE